MSDDQEEPFSVVGLLMQDMMEVGVEPSSPRRFRKILSREQFAEFHDAARRAAECLRGITIWNVNSTERGGGVAEMLRGLLGYARGGGLDVRWLVIRGEPEFFEVTKRIHNLLHGSPGDGGELGPDARGVYERGLAGAAADLAQRVAPGDVVVLHDPQTAGLAPAARRLGATVVWRCHIGTDATSDLADGGWDFLIPYLAEVDACVFSRRQFVCRGLDAGRVHIIPPSLDAFSARNRDLDEGTARSILSGGGVVPVAPSLDGRSTIAAPATITARATMVEDAPVPPLAPVVAQVSRWDRLKDPVGVIEGFASQVAPASEAHLVVAGPSSESVADDPEAAEVLRDCVEVRTALPAAVRARVHLACLPMHDEDENALLVNAIQRRAHVVVQKSLAEGFGLTVAEAMWKARPVVASRVGGIQDQVEDGRTGLLVADPSDLAGFGEAIRVLLQHRERAEAMGRAAREAVRERFLAPRHLRQYADLLAAVVERVEAPAG
jgi:trehalose synthase